MPDIDIGPACIDRGSGFDATYTVINKDNPANAAGKITKVYIWAMVDMSGVEVATFYITNGNTFTTRDSESIPGIITVGACREYTVALDVEIDDYIGLCLTGGTVERDTSGFAGIWYKSGDNIPCTTTAFTFLAGDAISLYGEGDAVVGKKTLVQAALISIPPLIVLPTLREILKLTGGC